MQPVPIVYAMTIGEYARMLNGEKWLELTPNAKAQQLNLIIIPLQNYSHNQQYQLKNKPSPNLPNMTAIYWYPSLGLFEGTKLSVGRGTAMPFQVIGNPSYTQAFSFTPKAISGAINPPFKDQLCHGWNLQMDESSARRKINGQLQLNYLIQAYQENNDKPHFFSAFFNKLAGSDKLRQQIVAGLSESEIRASWQPDLSKFKKIRAKYLLYPDN